MGIAAAVAFQDDVSGEENAKRMAEAAEHVKTGTVTYAVRDSEYNGVQIHKGDIIGMHNGKIEYCGNSVHDVVLDMMKAVVTDDAELITVYYGADTTKEEAEQVAAEIAVSELRRGLPAGRSAAVLLSDFCGVKSKWSFPPSRALAQPGWNPFAQWASAHCAICCIFFRSATRTEHIRFPVRTQTAARCW